VTRATTPRATRPWARRSTTATGLSSTRAHGPLGCFSSWTACVLQLVIFPSPPLTQRSIYTHHRPAYLGANESTKPYDTFIADHCVRHPPFSFFVLILTTLPFPSLCSSLQLCLLSVKHKHHGS
jgi:hypothetical protein